MKEIEPTNPRKKFEAELRGIFDTSSVPVEWGDEEKKRANDIVSDLRVTTARFSSIPMTCRGSACHSAQRCPLYKEELAPIGEPCPIETKIIAELTYEIMEELEVDPDSRLEVGMIRDLIDQEIQQLRKQNLLSQEDIVQENVIGIDENGEPIMKKELNLAVDWEDKIHKRKNVIMKELLATRKARVDAGAKVLDQASNMANLLNEYAKVSAKDDELIDSVGMGGHRDSYIEAQEALKQESGDSEDGDS